MEKDRVFQGKWHLPNSDKETFTGTLRYTREEGCYLELQGCFEDFTPITRRHSIILGTAIDAGMITLVDCIRKHRRSNLNGVTVSKYSVTFAVIGGHFEKIDELQFDKITASISDFESWVGIYGFKDLNINFTDSAVDILYQLPENKNIEINDFLKLTLEFGYSFPIVKDYYKAEIIQSTTVGLSFVNQLSLRDALKWYFRLHKFFALSYYDTPQILNIFLNNKAFEVPEGMQNFSLELLYSDNLYNPNYKGEKEGYDFLYTYQDIQESFPLMLTNWFNLIESVEDAINLFNELLMKRRYPLELKFLSAIQAVESFHRNIYGGVDIPEDEHLERIALILEKVPENLQQWLKSRLEYSNEPNLRRRLKDLYERIPIEVTSSLIRKRKEFVEGVVNTRNYFTHYNPRLREKVFSNSETAKCVEKLKILLICLILNELGLSKEKLLSFIKVEKLYPYGEI